MNVTKLLIVLLLLGATGVSNAGGRHGGHRSHGHFSVIVGPYWGPYWGPRYYPPYYAPIVVERSAPLVYIEQQPALLAPPPSASGIATPSNYWYYCAPAAGYYPYVKECPGGWQKVLPQPSGQP